jgi:type VI protein secretion system component Hcp
MSRKTLFAAVVVACLVSGLAPAAEAQKQMTAFLRLEGIAGESADTKHRGDIDIESFGWSESQSGQGSPPGGGRASERVNAGSFQFSAYTSLASPRLFQTCAMGQRVKTAVLTVRSRAGLEYMTWRLTDVSVRPHARRVQPGIFEDRVRVPADPAQRPAGPAREGRMGSGPEQGLLSILRRGAGACRVQVPMAEKGHPRMPLPVPRLRADGIKGPDAIFSCARRGFSGRPPA